MKYRIQKRKAVMRRGNYYPKGVTVTEGRTQFVFCAEKSRKEIEIGIFTGEKELARIAVPEDCRQGQLYSVVVEKLPKGADSYCYYVDQKSLPDPYAKGVAGMRSYGKAKGRLRYILPEEAYDWEEDRFPRHSYGNSVIYGIHVRGFTKHSSSEVRKKGTFAGLQEKIPYLKELGITAVELMPAYEFDEMEPVELPFGEDGGSKINYWGFKEGYYYAPKSAYAYSIDAAAEMKGMVKALHKADIEVLMQFYFPESCRISEIPDILHFWTQEYHIDGFHLLGENLPLSVLVSDPFLKDTKLICDRFPTDAFRRERDFSRNCALWRESFTNDMRGLLKGDGGCLESMIFHLQDNEERMGIVNTIAGYNGFTLYDLVSYEGKHNEENGEDNRDGADQNFSWNCGVEGKTRKRAVQMLRSRQMRNALALVFLSQGTPYLQSGDEFGQTQRGNNNPYCQDNAVTWLDWRRLRANRDLYEYTKQLICFRNGHPVFHREQVLKGIDYRSFGSPDISFHGREAWKPMLDYSYRHIGVMYCGKYAEDEHGQPDADFYVAYNMHWEPHEFALPKIPKGMRWKLCMDTALPGSGMDEREEPEAVSDNYILAEARSIQIYQTEKRKEK